MSQRLRGYLRVPAVLVVGTLLLGGTRTAYGQWQPGPEGRLSPVRIQQMNEEMEGYFEGEKKGAIWLMGLGGGGLVIGTTLLAQAGAHRGAGYPIVGVSVLQLLLGIGLWRRTDPQVERLRTRLERSPEAYRAEELRRMRRVTRNFRIFFYTELALIAGGVAMAAVGGSRQSETLKGAGVGLAIEAAILLGFDFFAARRARAYVRALEGFQVAPQLSFQDGGRLLGLMVGKTF